MKKTSKLNVSQRAIVGHGPTSQQLKSKVWTSNYLSFWLRFLPRNVNYFLSWNTIKISGKTSLVTNKMPQFITSSSHICSSTNIRIEIRCKIWSTWTKFSMWLLKFSTYYFYYLYWWKYGKYSRNILNLFKKIKAFLLKDSQLQIDCQVLRRVGAQIVLQMASFWSWLIQVLLLCLVYI